MRFSMTFAAFMFLGGLNSPASAAENWPQFRGPFGAGAVMSGDYPVKFSSDKGLAWKIDLPGRGTSTPAVWGDLVVVTSGIDGEDGATAYGLDGGKRWQKTVGAEKPGKNPHASGSNPSPATDGKHIIVYFKSGTLACLDVDGKVLWQTNLVQKYGPDTLWWDRGTSPLIVGDRVVVAVMQAGDSYLAAFSLDDGKELWKQSRQYKCTTESDQSYTTPQLARIDGRDVIVTWGADHLTGHDADTGKLLWECGGFNPDNKPNWRTIASATIDGDVALIPYGRGDCLAGVRLGGQGDVTVTNRLWEKADRGISADVPTPAASDGKAYVLGDIGQLTCFDVASGNQLWSANLPKSRSKFYASPLLAGGKLYCAREDGAVFVASTKDGSELAENNMGEEIFATPVAVRDGLLLRGGKHLFWIAGTETAAHSEDQSK